MSQSGDPVQASRRSGTQAPGGGGSGSCGMSLSSDATQCKHDAGVSNPFVPLRFAVDAAISGGLPRIPTRNPATEPTNSGKTKKKRPMTPTTATNSSPSPRGVSSGRQLHPSPMALAVSSLTGRADVALATRSRESSNGAHHPCYRTAPPPTTAVQSQLPPIEAAPAGGAPSTSATASGGGTSILTAARQHHGHHHTMVLTEDGTTRPSALPLGFAPKTHLTKDQDLFKPAVAGSSTSNTDAQPPDLVDVASLVVPEDRDAFLSHRVGAGGGAVHPTRSAACRMPRLSCGAIVALLAFCTMAAIVVPVSILGLLACANVWQEGALREVRQLALQGAQLVQLDAVRPAAYAGETTALNMRITEAWCRPMYNASNDGASGDTSVQWNSDADPPVDCRSVAGVVAPLLPWATDITYLSNRHFDIIALRNASAVNQPSAPVADASRGSFETWYRRGTWGRCNQTSSGGIGGAEAGDGDVGWEELQAVHDADWIAPLAAQLLVSLPERCRGANGADIEQQATRHVKPGTIAGEVVFPGGFYVSVWCMSTPPPGAALEGDGHSNASSEQPWVGITSVVVLPNVFDEAVGVPPPSAVQQQRRGMLRELMFPSSDTVRVLTWLQTRTAPIVAADLCTSSGSGHSASMPANGTTSGRLHRLDDAATNASSSPNRTMVRYEWCADDACVWMNASRVYKEVVAQMWEDQEGGQQHPSSPGTAPPSPTATVQDNETTSIAPTLEPVCGSRGGGGHTNEATVWWRSSAGGDGSDAMASSTSSACTATALDGAVVPGTNNNSTNNKHNAAVVVVCFEQAPIRCIVARDKRNKQTTTSTTTTTSTADNVTVARMATCSEHVGLLVLDAKRRRVESIWGFDYIKGTVVLPSLGWNDAACTSVDGRHRLPSPIAGHDAANTTTGGGTVGATVAFPLSAHLTVLLQGGVAVVPDAGPELPDVNNVSNASHFYVSHQRIFSKWEPSLRDAATVRVKSAIDGYRPMTTTPQNDGGCLKLQGSAVPSFATGMDDNVAWSVAHVGPSDVLVVALWHHHEGASLRIFDIALSFAQAVVALCVAIACSFAMRRMFYSLRGLKTLVKRLDGAFVVALAAEEKQRAESVEESQLHRSGGGEQQQLALSVVLPLWRRLLHGSSQVPSALRLYSKEIAEFAALFAIARWESKTLLERLEAEQHALRRSPVAAAPPQCPSNPTTAPQHNDSRRAHRRMVRRSPSTNEGDHGSGGGGDGREHSVSARGGSPSPTTPTASTGGDTTPTVLSRRGTPPSSRTPLLVSASAVGRAGTPRGRPSPLQHPQGGVGGDADNVSDGHRAASQPTTPWSSQPPPPTSAAPKTSLVLQPCGPTIIMTIRFPHNRLDSVQRDLPWASLSRAQRGSSGGLGLSFQTSAASSSYQASKATTGKSTVSPFEYLGVVFRIAAAHKAVIERVVSHQELVLSFGGQCNQGCYTQPTQQQQRGGGSNNSGGGVGDVDGQPSSLTSASFSRDATPQQRPRAQNPLRRNSAATQSSPVVAQSPFLRQSAFEDEVNAALDIGGVGGGVGTTLPALRTASASRVNSNYNAGGPPCFYNTTVPAGGYLPPAASEAAAEDAFGCATSVIRRIHDVFFTASPEWVEAQAVRLVPSPPPQPSCATAATSPVAPRCAGQLPLLQITIDTSNVFLGCSSTVVKTDDDAEAEDDDEVRQDEQFLVGDALDRIAGLHALQDARHPHASIVCTTPYATLLQHHPARHLLLPVDTLRTSLRCGMPRTDAVTVYVVVEPLCVAVGEGTTLSLENQPRAATAFLNRIQTLTVRQHDLAATSMERRGDALGGGVHSTNDSTATTTTGPPGVPPAPAQTAAPPRMDVASKNMLPQLRGMPVAPVVIPRDVGPSHLYTLQELLWLVFNDGSNTMPADEAVRARGSSDDDGVRGGGSGNSSCDATAAAAMAYLRRIAGSRDPSPSAPTTGPSSLVSPRGSNISPVPVFPLFLYDIVDATHSPSRPAAGSTRLVRPAEASLSCSDSSVEIPWGAAAVGVAVSHLWDDLEQIGPDGGDANL